MNYRQLKYKSCKETLQKVASNHQKYIVLGLHIFYVKLRHFVSHFVHCSNCSVASISFSRCFNDTVLWCNLLFVAINISRYVYLEIFIFVSYFPYRSHCYIIAIDLPPPIHRTESSRSYCSRYVISFSI